MGSEGSMLFFMAGLVFAQDCSMYNDASAPIHWFSAPIYYTVNPSNDENLADDEVVAAVQAATQAWQQPETAVTFEYQGQSSLQESSWEDQNTVYWAADWLRDTGLLASAMVWSDDSGAAVAFDIPINGPGYAWDTQGEEDKVDLQNAITHEMGHVLGLGHLPDPNATMYDSAVKGELNKRDLDQEDISCIQTLYPQGEAATSAQYPLASSTSPNAPAMISMMALIFLRTRRGNQ